MNCLNQPDRFSISQNFINSHMRIRKIKIKKSRRRGHPEKIITMEHASKKQVQIKSAMILSWLINKIVLNSDNTKYMADACTST